MLEVSVVGRLTDADDLVTRLQAAGLVHPVPFDVQRTGDKLTIADSEAVHERDHLRLLRRAIADVPAAGRAEQADFADFTAATAQVQRLVERLDSARDDVSRVDGAMQALEPWGDLEPSDAAALLAAGVHVRFCVLAEALWDALDLAADVAAGRIAYHVTERDAGELWVVFFGPAAAELELTGQRLPGESMTVLRARRQHLQREIADLQRELGRYHGLIAAIDHRQDALADRVAVLQCRDSALHDGTLFAVRGYVPTGRYHDLLAALTGLPCAVSAQTPEAGDRVPVDFDNGPLFQGFETIVRAFSGISYWEKDFTWAVGLLFVVFGALCLLDGGYGLLLLATGIGLRKRGIEGFGRVFVATGVVSTFIGMISGQYFGLVVGRDILLGSTPLTPLAADPFACFVFSLVVGVIGMGFSYGMAIWQRGVATNATGSLLMVFAGANLGVAKSNPSWLFTPFMDAASAAQFADSAASLGQGVATVSCALGVLAWIAWPDRVFGDDNRIANVVWTLYAGLTGLAQDVMSHMRLFGIALSGSIMALVVNQVSAQMPLPVAILLAVCGHLAVYVLALLSLYIHTNRLIFLEFGSKCFDGGELWYEPLRRRQSA